MRDKKEAVREERWEEEEEEEKTREVISTNLIWPVSKLQKRDISEKKL